MRSSSVFNGITMGLLSNLSCLQSLLMAIFYSSAIEELKPMKNADYPDAKTRLDLSQYTPPKEQHWLFRRFFILSWINDYDKEQAIADLISGITLGLTIIPQSIAYASLAGLTAEYGLYTAIIGKIVYIFFGTIPTVSIGPSSLMSLLVLQFVGDRPIQFVVVLSFLSGLVELLMGVFELGFVVNTIPLPVIKAFTSATAAIVALVQVKSLLGVKLKGMPSVHDLWANIRKGDAAMGLSCLIVLSAMGALSHIKFNRINATTRRIKKIFWYISISRYAFVVVVCSLIAFTWSEKLGGLDAVPITLTPKVESAELALNIPPFAFEYNNSTFVFSDICGELGSGIIVVPIVAILVNVAIARAFVTDGSIDNSQEMITLGICNLVGAFFRCMPTCGAFTRSAVAKASGVRTPLSGLYTALIVLSALGLLTPYFQYIPVPAIAAVLIAAVSCLIDLKPIKEYWISNKKDFLSWTGCFVVCLLAGVQMGLLFGIVINMIFILLRLGLPKVEATVKECHGTPYLHIIPQTDIYYTGVDFLRQEIFKACKLYQYDFPVVLDCSRFMQFDATFMEVVISIIKELGENDVLLVLQKVSHKVQPLLPKESLNVRICNSYLTAEDLVFRRSISLSSRSVS